jgi:poly(3-hydroxybutyrate) depolymerase
MLGALAVCVVAVAAVIGFVITRSGPARDARYHRGDSVVSGDSVVRGDTYHYLVFVPASYRAASKVPLVVVLHGCQTTASQQAVASGYAAIAEQRRFLADRAALPPASQRPLRRRWRTPHWPQWGRMRA